VEWECLQERQGKGIGKVVHLSLSPQFGEVEVLAMGSQPVAGENAGVGMYRLSIKLNGQRVDGDGDIRMEKTLHVKCARKQCGLREVLMFCEGQERTIEVAVRDEDDGVATWVGPKGKDASYGSLCGSKCAIMVGVESLFDADTISQEDHSPRHIQPPIDQPSR